MSTAVTRVNESLWQIEDDLDALLNSVDLVEDEAELEQLKFEIVSTLERAVAKRDQVAAWLAREEANVAAIDAEIARLRQLKEKRCRAIGKVEEYVIGLILSKGPAAKGRFPALEGVTSRFSVRKNPPAIEILDEALIPERFERIALEFSPEDWQSFTGDLEIEIYSRLADHITTRMPSKMAIKRVLDAGEMVAGASCAPAKYRLERQ